MFINQLLNNLIIMETIQKNFVTDDMLDNIDKKEYEEPTCTSNQLKDVVVWLQNGSLVVLHNKYGQVQIYHNKCQENPNYDDRICCVNCNSVPGILDKGEWDYYIDNKQKGKNNVCTCKNVLHVVNELIKKKAKNVFLFSG